jgi:hypothetical protein
MCIAWRKPTRLSHTIAGKQRDAIELKVESCR